MEWGLNEDGEYYYSENYLESHVCSEEELGLTGDSATFMPIKQSSEEELKVSSGFLRCID